ncbi:MAG: hypothetical protein COV36_04570 [Alphaproteobacteria bacterium CG11_big_fil_rev_8_21_14_0_20_44_7]|nr:MAG: hypothetical protein COV36_04570 [Alphaproteobacteria bacterium CG11_big_fil_rev_8_21_14_0_20_44_7]
MTIATSILAQGAKGATSAVTDAQRAASFATRLNATHSVKSGKVDIYLANLAEAAGKLLSPGSGDEFMKNQWLTTYAATRGRLNTELANDENAAGKIARRDGNLPSSLEMLDSIEAALVERYSSQGFERARMATNNNAQNFISGLDDLSRLTPII